jgi:outer membrane receptor protein involved in Fe transport
VRRRVLLTLFVLVGGLGVSAGAARAQLPVSPLSPVLQLEAQQPRRAPFTLTPSLTVSEEYNDNVFLDNANKHSDFITGFTPALSAVVESPTYRLLASYDFTAEVYARETDLTDGYNRANGVINAFYRLTPRLTVSFDDTYHYDKNPSLVTLEAVTPGRTTAWSNTVSPGVSYQVDSRTTVRFTAAYTATRFNDAALSDSDVYRTDAAVDYAFTPRLTGTAGYQFGYFDIENQDKVQTHTPRVGITYQFTETLTGAASAGPTFVTDDISDVTAAATVSVVQRFRWGAIGFLYDRAVGTSGGLGGASVNETIGLLAQLTNLMRNLTIEFGPRYTMVRSETNDAVDARTITLSLRGVYQFTPGIAAVASYSFYQQRPDAAQSAVIDVDQNRVFLGLTLGYPIRFD